MAANAVYLYPEDTNDLHVYQGTDGVYVTVIYEADGVTPLDLTGIVFTTYILRSPGGTVLSSVTANNNHGVAAGQVIIIIPKAQLSEMTVDTTGGWELYGTKDSKFELYDHGKLFVKDNLAT